jgi:uncharacterized damage-inducible protein DinB
MDRSVIDQYEKGVEELRRAIAGMSEADLKAVPIAGKWSTHQVVIHLADAETAFADRIKRILAMDNPQLLAWDENRFVERLHSDAQSTQDAVELIALTRRQTARIIRAASDADLTERAGIHSERGRQTVKEVLGYAVPHLVHHLKFVAEKRKALGR